MSKYRFDCGCAFDIVDDTVKDNDGLPGIKIDYENIPEDCPATWQLIQSGHTKGVFQLETNLGRKWAKELAPTNITEMAALVSLMRPGCLRSLIDGKSMTQHYCDRKNVGEEVKYFHEALEPILNETYGVLTYQEESMRIATDIAGFNLQEADVLRKCVTKDTMFVSQQRGWISIQELIKTGYKQDLFLVMDELGNQQWKHIEKIWPTGNHDVQQIETNSGMYVNATKYHQFLTNNSWKARLRLTKDDYIVCAKEIEYKGQDIISPDLAFIIGGIITEGYFTKDNSSTFVNHDIKMMQWFVSRHERVFGFGKTNNDPHVFTIKQHVKDKIAKYLKFGKSKDKEIPQEMMGATLGTTQDFLSFMFGGDGGVCESSGQFEYVSKSKKLIHQIQLLLLRFGIRSYINIKHIEKYGDFYRLYINDQADQQKLYDKLSCWWPVEKRNMLQRILSNKTKQNYTTDVIPPNIVAQMVNQYPFIANYEGGSIYSQPISRKRFERLANKTADPYWQTLAGGQQQYQLIRNFNTKKRQQITYDFTVEGDDTPYIIANGLVIHNSIGKKDASLMTKVKSGFLDGCKKTGIVSDEEAEEIFGWIQESQRYSFNKSHGVSYGLMGYWSAYVKAHFPYHFYTSWLYYSHEKMDPQEEMQLLISDARYFDIEVRPPSLNHIFRGDIGHFALYDNCVYFGIGDIKRIGDALVSKVTENVRQIEEKLGRTIDKWTWSDFLLHFSDNVTTTAVNGMIASGATDFMHGSRVQKIHEYETWKKLTQKERDWIRDNYNGTNLIEGIELMLNNKPRTTKPRIAKITDVLYHAKNAPFSLEDTAYYIAQKETELLGVPITCTKLDTCNGNKEPDTTCKEFLHGKSGKMSIAVEITEAKEYIISKGKMKGQKMMFIAAEDSTASLDSITVFPRTLEGNEPLLIKGSTVLLTGQRDRQRSESFIVDSITQI